MATYYHLILLAALVGSANGDDCQDTVTGLPNRKYVGFFKLEDQCADGRYLLTETAPTLTIGTAAYEYASNVTYWMYVYGSSTPAYISLQSWKTGQYVTRQGLNAGANAKTTVGPQSAPISCDDDRLFVYGTTTSDLISLESEMIAGRPKAFLIPQSLQPRLSVSDEFWSLYNYMVEFSSSGGVISIIIPAGCAPSGRRRRDIPSGTQLYGTQPGSGVLSGSGIVPGSDAISGSVGSEGLSNTPSGTSRRDGGPRPSCAGQTLYLSASSTNQIELSREFTSRTTLSIEQYQLYEGYDRFGRFSTGETIIIGIPNARRYISVYIDTTLGVVPLNETRNRGGIYYMPQPIMYQSVITRAHDEMVPLPIPERCKNPYNSNTGHYQSYQGQGQAQRPQAYHSPTEPETYLNQQQHPQSNRQSYSPSQPTSYSHPSPQSQPRPQPHPQNYPRPQPHPLNYTRPQSHPQNYPRPQPNPQQPNPYSLPSPQHYPQPHPSPNSYPRPQPNPQNYPRPTPSPHPYPPHGPRPKPTLEGDACLLKYSVDERVFKVIRTENSVRLQHGVDSTRYLASLLLEDGSYRLVVTSLSLHISRDLLNFDFNIPVKRIPRGSYHRGPNTNRGRRGRFSPFCASG